MAEAVARPKDAAGLIALDERGCSGSVEEGLAYEGLACPAGDRARLVDLETTDGAGREDGFGADGESERVSQPVECVRLELAGEWFQGGVEQA